jgi:hypothetical protein
MTRKEYTGTRDLTFSGWIRNNLPDSDTGFSASDLDFILWNWKTKKVMLLEIKTRMSNPRVGQKMMWKNINRWMFKGIDDDWLYLGFHLIQFENTSFEDGKCYLDYIEISETDLISYLSFTN